MTNSVGAGTTRSCGRGCSASSCGSRSSSISTSTLQGTKSTPARYARTCLVPTERLVSWTRAPPATSTRRAAPRRAAPPPSESPQRCRGQVEKRRPRRACPHSDPILFGRDPILFGRAGGEPPRPFRETLPEPDRAAPGPLSRQRWPAWLFTTSQLRPGGEALTCARRDLCFVRR